MVELSSTGAPLPSVVPGTLHATNAPTSSCCSPEIFEPSGDFLVAQIFGTTRLHSDVQVERFSETGVLDTTFTSTPVAVGPGENEPQIIVLQPNGQILVGGLTNARQTPIEGGFALLNANGTVDTSFGTGGAVVNRCACQPARPEQRKNCGHWLGRWGPGAVAVSGELMAVGVIRSLGKVGRPQTLPRKITALPSFDRKRLV